MLGDDKAIWKDFRRELIREGFSSEVLEKHMETIKDYVLELGNRGALDDVEDDTELERLSLDGIVRSDEPEDVAEEDELDHSAFRPQDVPEANLEQELARKSETTSETSSSQEREQTLKQQKQGKTENDEDEMQSPTERRNMDESSESNDDDVGGNGCEPLVDRSHHCSEEPTNITLKSNDERTSTNAEHTYSGVGLQTSNNLQTIFQRHGSLTNRAVQVNNVELPTVFVNRYNSSPSIDIRQYPNLIYNSKYYGGNVGSGHKWFGPYYNHWDWVYLQVYTNTALFGHKRALSGRFYHPHAICYWMLILARAYEGVQSSDNLPTTPPKILSPLADELQLLVGRACAYLYRISLLGTNQQRDQYLSRFLEILETLYLFIRGGLCHMLSLNEDKNAPETLWVFDWDLSWQQVKDVFGTTRTVSHDTENARPIFALTPKAGVDVVQGVFRDGHIVHSLDYRTSSLADLVNDLQFLLVFFKRSCEDDVLQEESKLPGKLNYRSSTPVDEMHDTDIANADYELKNCKIALDNWSDNNYSRTEAKIVGFATKKASLSTILERCDEAQFRLHRARLRFAESRGRRAADGERNAKRGSKKRK
jgi:hypothetical protein